LASLATTSPREFLGSFRSRALRVEAVKGDISCLRRIYNRFYVEKKSEHHHGGGAAGTEFSKLTL
jgi:hypothetical protein